MTEEEGYHPHVRVDFAPTEAFVKAYPAETVEEHRGRFNEPTWTLGQHQQVQPPLPTPKKEELPPPPSTTPEPFLPTQLEEAERAALRQELQLLGLGFLLVLALSVGALVVALVK